MRKLTDHIVEGDSVNHKVEVSVLDEAGQGGTYHEYEITWSKGESRTVVTKISFQNGPIQEFGINGLTNESLLAIVIDRMRGFQAGPYACRENAIVLTHLEEALMWLQRRTRERIKRGVRGVNQK